MEDWIQKPTNTPAGPEEEILGICSSLCFIDCDLCLMYVY